MVLKIREYKDEDKNEVISIWKYIFNYSKQHNDPELIIDMKLSHKDNLFFVAEENKQIVGTIMAGFDGHRGWLYSLAVISNKRNQGIGKLLVDKAIVELERLGCLKVNLQIISGKDSVISFYKKLGFSIEDRISMGKIIED
jgi:ribosomal protein S18 acetylase RimI-like enzyme